VPSMPLGVMDVTPWELIDAYTAFASLGSKVQPRLVTSVEDRDGTTVWGQEPQAQQTLDPAVAFVMTSMLRQVVDRGTGTPARAAGYRAPAAGKTGTTQSGADAWFIGFTPRLTMGIWIGFDRPSPIAGKATGGALAGPIWGRIMERAAAPSGGWSAPPGVDRLWVGGGGTVVASDCPPPAGAQPMWFISGTAPETSGCAVTGSYAQVGGTDTIPIDSSQVPGAAQDGAVQGWWNRLRARILADSTAAAVPGAPLAGRAGARDSASLSPADSAKLTPRLAGKPLPGRGGDAAPDARPRPAPPPADAQPAPPPPPPDTSGGARA